MKLQGVSEEYENLTSANEELQSQNENLRYDNLQQERNLEYNKRMHENYKQAMQNEIAYLSSTREQLQQSVDTVGDQLKKLCNKKERMEEVVYRFRTRNRTYNKIKSLAEEHLSNLLTHNEADTPRRI